MTASHGPTSAYTIVRAILLGVAIPLGIASLAALGILYRDRVAAGIDRTLDAVHRLLARWDSWRAGEPAHGKHRAEDYADIVPIVVHRTPRAIRAAAPVAQWPARQTPLMHDWIAGLPAQWRDSPVHAEYVAAHEQNDEPTCALAIGGRA